MSRAAGRRKVFLPMSRGRKENCQKVYFIGTASAHSIACTKFTKNGISDGNEEKKNRKLSTGKTAGNMGFSIYTRNYPQYPQSFRSGQVRKYESFQNECFGAFCQKYFSGEISAEISDSTKVLKQKQIS